jgi:hypothetical protein
MVINDIRGKTNKRRYRLKKTDSLKLWSSEPYLLIHVTLVQRKRLLKHATKLADLAFERSAVWPRERRVEEFARDTLNRGRDLQAERLKRLVLRILELARVHRIDDAPRHRERATLARAVSAAGPASVDQPAVDFVPVHTICEHLGVATGLR